MKEKKTNRGFKYIEFKDFYGEDCSLQESSTAFYKCLWLGVDKIKPKILHTDATKLGINHNNVKEGWIDYEIPEEVLIGGRMHLEKEQVKNLIKILQNWLDDKSLDDGLSNIEAKGE